MSAGEWVGIGVGVLAILAALYRVLLAIYRFARLLETGNDRLGKVEAQLVPNGGNSARDVLDQVHSIARENHAANERIEAQATDAARVAGRAAAVADATAQRFAEFAAESQRRHEENLQRLTQLEDTDQAFAVQREFLLGILKHTYDIDLLPAEDSDDDG